MSYTYDYPRPMLTVDIVVFALRENSVLLIKRKEEPFKDCWALPGGFVNEHEDLHDAARRELLEETGLRLERLYQTCTLGSPDRDPRGHVVSVVYSGTIARELQAVGSDDAAAPTWFPLGTIPSLAFDHDIAIAESTDRLFG